MDNRRKKIKLVLFCVGGVLISFLFGIFVEMKYIATRDISILEYRSSVKYSFINPLIDGEEVTQSSSLRKLKNNTTKLINEAKKRWVCVRSLFLLPRSR